MGASGRMPIQSPDSGQRFCTLGQGIQREIAKRVLKHKEPNNLPFLTFSGIYWGKQTRGICLDHSAGREERRDLFENEP